MVTVKLEKKIKGLHQAVFDAEEHFLICRAWEDSLTKYRDLHEEYGCLFSPTRLAHFVAMIMALGTIFDSKEYGLGRFHYDQETKQGKYGQFLSTVRDSSNDVVIDKIEQFLEMNSEIINNIRSIRDKHFAHCELNVEEILRRAPLTWEDCRGIIEGIKDLLNKLSRTCGMGEFEGEQHAAETLNRLLESLKIADQKNRYLRILSDNKRLVSI